jgi:hypothetical protein
MISHGVVSFMGWVMIAKWVFVALVWAQWPDIATAQSQDEIVLMQSVLGKVHSGSTQENVEYCGYIGRDRSGQLIATPATCGGNRTCLAQFPSSLSDIVASYHTHGAHSVAFTKNCQVSVT